MGIDLIRGGRIANRGFRTTKSTNNYLNSLIKVKFYHNLVIFFLTKKN